MPETCDVCGRIPVDAMEQFDPERSLCWRLVVEGDSAAWSECYRLGYERMLTELARVKEERDQARSAAERHANRADDFRAKAMDTQKTLNCEIEAHDRTRAALSEVQAQRDSARAECEKLAARTGELHRELTNAQDERDRLQRERDEARRSKEFTDQWYACRFERLRKELDDKGEIGAKAYHAIVANGVGPGPEYEPPTYAQQLNTAIYRADTAEARASSLEKQLSEAQAQRDEALAHLLGKERCTQPCAICDERRASEIELAALRAQNATQHESVDTAMRAEREARALLLELRNALDADGMVLDLNAALSRIDAYLAAPAQEQPRAAPSERHDGKKCPECIREKAAGIIDPDFEDTAGLPKEGGE